MTNDYRAMCAELLEALEIQLDELRFNNRLCIRARTLLAQPEPEGLTDEELAELRGTASGLESQSYPQTAALITRAAELLEQRHPAPVPVSERLPGPEEKRMDTDTKASAAPSGTVKAVVRCGGCRHWGQDCEFAQVHQCGHPRFGQLVWQMGHAEGPICTEADFGCILGEAANAQISGGTPSAESGGHPTPVPVSERLPGPEDCDAEGRCWLLTVEDEYPQWRLHSIEGAQPGGTMIWVPVDSSPGVLVDCFYTSHWLPAHALPIPEAKP